jgi:hypothetical protein
MEWEDESNATDVVGNSSVSVTTIDPRYFIQPHADPELAACTNVVLKSDLQVRSDFASVSLSPDQVSRTAVFNASLFSRLKLSVKD